MTLTKLELARQIAARYAEIPLVRAVAVSGSTASQAAEPGSDIDMYIYVERAVPLDQRMIAAQPYNPDAEFDLQLFETTDNYVNAETGYPLDVLYRWVSWTEGEMARIFDEPVGWLGYTTSVWYNIKIALPLFDRDGWFAGIQAKAKQPYPEALRRAIIEKNTLVARSTMFSYMQQIEKAVKRGDLVSVNHRIAALLASYFDILFALNRQPNPGEKRLISFAETLCPLRPEQMRTDIEAVLRLGGTGDPATPAAAQHLLDQLNPLLTAEGFTAV
jgi:hypothetical protein